MKNYKDAIKNHLTSETLLVPGLFGPHGIGKTSLVASIAKDLGLDLLTINLAALEPSDFSGRVIIDANGLSSFSKPKFLDHSGLIFLDEINRAHDMSVKACLNSLLLDRKINGHALRPETKIICAGNIGDMYETSELDASLWSRIIRIDLENSLETWSQFEKSVRPSPLVDFIVSCPDLVKQFDFRRLTEANKFYVSAKTHIGLEYILNHSLVELFNESLHKNNLKFSDVLDGKLGALNSTNPVRLTMVAHDCASHIEKGLASKNDLKNIREFILAIGNESKLAFFSDIKKTSDTMDPSQFKTIAESLKSAKFFDGELKEYLKVIFNRGQGNE